MVIFSILSPFVSWGAAAQPIQPKLSAEKTNADQNKIIIKGKIASFGDRYYVLGQNPPGEFLIENENSKVLGALLKEGKILTVEGHTTLGADLLFIEKINGKKYFAAKTGR
jgi:hypothetical protein